MIEILKDWSAHIMSALGIIGGLWAYFRHDKKLKAQEKRLNDMQIRQIQKAEEKELQAEIKCNTNYKEKGAMSIRIINAGRSDALNVRIQFITPDTELSGVYFHGKWGPYDMINPQSYREERLNLCSNHPDAISIKVTWDDSYKKDRTVTAMLPLK